MKSIFLKPSVKDNNSFMIKDSDETSMTKVKDILSIKEPLKQSESQIESLNLDSLLNSYKQESKVELDDPLAVFNKEDEKDSKLVETDQEVLDKEIAEDIALKSNRFSRLFKKDKHDIEKLRSAIINKNEKSDEEERASKILMPLMLVSPQIARNSQNKHFSVKGLNILVVALFAL